MPGRDVCPRHRATDGAAGRVPGLTPDIPLKRGGELAGHRDRVLEQVEDGTVLVDRRGELGVAFRTLRSGHRHLDPDRGEAGPHGVVQAEEAAQVRADLDAGTLLRLVSGIAMAAEHAPAGAGPLLPWVLDGILRRPSPETARPDATAPMETRATA